LASKILAGIFAEIDKLILKFTWKFKKPNIAKTILKEKTKRRNSHFPISKLTTKATVNKTGW
jgi:hypothetical protein